MKKIIFVLIITLSLLLLGCTQPNNTDQPTNQNDTNSTFKLVENSICEIEGKPVIRLYSTTWCSHCNWVKNTFDSVVNEYVEDDKIIAYHWQLDNDTDSLTGKTVIPESEKAVFEQFNPKGSIPTFVFGCKYYRIGNGYEPVGKVSEEENNSRLFLEEAEFRKIIEELISQSKE